MKQDLYKILLVVSFAVLFCVPLYAAEHNSANMDMPKSEINPETDKGDAHENMDMTDNEHAHKETTKEEKAKIGVTEKLGEYIELSAVFKNSKGETVTLKELVDKPTIFAPVYYSCPNVCNFLQTSLADVIPQIKLKSGDDYQVISVSFDENDTPETAASKKKNYMKAADGKIPDKGWLFLSGDRENILKFTDSVGFNFMRRGVDFAHPVAVMAVSPTGKIVRYLYGTDPLPFELTMAAVEASKEQTGLSVKKLVAYCFSYDPEGKKYVFDIMKISGIVVLSVLFIFAAYLIFGGKKRKK
ncbi:MAG: SCO family protein [Denitrovibrio sp.]|nr:MAG: SCO family protein [Denitrovibrio sp.]